MMNPNGHEKGNRTAETATSSEKRPMLVALRQRQALRNRAVALLGAMVAIATALALMMPAITMTHGDLICGIEEHTHSDACYERVLVCGQDEGEDHAHTDVCYESKLTCNLPEHVHSDVCYAEPEPVSKSQPDPDSQSGGELPGVLAGVGVADSGSVPAEEAKGSKETGKSPNALAGGDANAVPGAAAPGSTDAGAETGSSASSGADAKEPAPKDDASPAQSFEANLVDAADAGKVVLTVSVDAPEGALPAGTSMKIDGIDADKVADEVEAAISYEPGLVGKVKASWTLAVDVSFTDADGNKVEPAKDVKVKLAAPLVRGFSEAAAAEAGTTKANGVNSLAVVHVLDAGKAREAGKLDGNSSPKKAEVVDGTALGNWDDNDKTRGAEDALRLKAGESGPYAIVGLEPLVAAEGESDASPAEGDSDASPAAGGDDGSLVVYDQEIQRFSEKVTDADGNVTLSVEVEAPADALPKGATMQVTPVTSQRVLDAAKDEASSKVDGINASRAGVVAADITFFDADNKMVEPAGDVHVSMSAPAAVEAAAKDPKANAPSELAVVHVSDDNKTAEVVKSADVDAANAAAEFDSAEFSVYALVYTVDFHWEIDGETYGR